MMKNKIISEISALSVLADFRLELDDFGSLKFSLSGRESEDSE